MSLSVAPPPLQPPAVALRVQSVTKEYGAVRALHGVDLTVYRHEVHALVGDNGAGKSTLIKIISGAQRPDGGRLELAGREVHFATPLDARDAGIETVYQDLSLAETLEAADNVFLGRELVSGGILGRLGFLDRDAMRRRTAERLVEFGITLPSERLECGSLSGGQKQAVAVARAAMWGSAVILMDEPTAALGVTQRELVYGLIRAMREQGLAVVLISHNIVEVFDLADRITVLRLGEVVLATRTAATTPDVVVRAMSGIGPHAAPATAR
jgi:simple sugar transport system ATP-binding protein